MKTSTIQYAYVAELPCAGDSFKAICSAMLLALACLAQSARAQPATNLLANGDFSAGTNGWTCVPVHAWGSFPKFLVPTWAPHCLPSQAGNPYLQLDVPAGADGYAEHPVILPASGAVLRLRVWGHLDPCTATISIIVNVWGGRTRQYVLDRFAPPILEANGGSSCSGNVPVTKEYNLMAFAGQPVRVRLEATSAGFNGAITDFDDVTITELAGAIGPAVRATGATPTTGRPSRPPGTPRSSCPPART